MELRDQWWMDRVFTDHLLPPYDDSIDDSNDDGGFGIAQCCSLKLGNATN
ncbi:hypothetical protein PP707_06005 [Acetobacter pasteurianus]|nr:hypothetical protein [Acetobacter pasteurianus]